MYIYVTLVALASPLGRVVATNLAALSRTAWISSDRRHAVGGAVGAAAGLVAIVAAKVGS